MARELFASEAIGPGLVVRESQLTGSARAVAIQAQHLVFTPTSGTYARLSRAEVELLHEELGRWLRR